MFSRVSHRALAAVVALTLLGACSDPERPQRGASAPTPATEATESTAAADDTVAAAATEAPPTTEAPRPLTLPERLEQIVVGMADRNIAVSVVDDAGQVVVDHNAHAPVIPASTAKLATAAAALAELGPEYRWLTRVAGSQPVLDGVVDGDVVVIGAGDPTISGGRYAEAVPERPRTPLEALADRIVAAGVTRITGRLVADAAVFPNQPHAPGVAHTGGDSSPPSAGLTTDGGRRVWHDGRRIHSVPADNPPQETVNLLAAALAVRGVAIDGGVIHYDGAGTRAPHPVADIASPPLVEVLRTMVQKSDNHLADAVFRTMGAKHGDGSWEGSGRVATAALQGLGLDVSQISLVDGSGLSRHGRITAEGLVRLDEVMAATPFAEHWYSLHAVAGSSGTLRGRLLDTPAAGRVAGKTGSLNGVRALAGFVTDGARPRFRFTVVGNDLDAAGIDAVTRAQDEIALALAERAAACVGRPACPAADPAP